LEEGEVVNVACLGNNNNLQATGKQTNDAVCISNRLVINTVAFSYNQLGCVSQNKEVLIEDATCAGGNGALIKVGWQFNSTYIPLYEMCHDKAGAFNYFASSVIIGNSVDADDKTNGRPSFSTGGYYPGLEVNTLYTQVRQKETIAQIVGSTDLANQYVDTGAQIFLSRGHMAPDGDFIDAASQDASYYFMNVAPQWQIFNAGSWV
jgi:DNA/RNA non-specific endonuclease